MPSRWRRLRSGARRLRLRGSYLGRRVIYTGPVALFNNCFCDSLRQQFAIFGIARLVAFGPIAQESALHQNCRTVRKAQDAEICCVHAPIHRVRDRHQFGLDPIRQFS